MGRRCGLGWDGEFVVLDICLVFARLGWRYHWILRYVGVDNCLRWVGDLVGLEIRLEKNLARLGIS